MNVTRSLFLVIVAAVSACAFGSNDTSDTTGIALKATKAASVIPLGPKIGFRIGGGTWDEFMINAGLDVTFNVPLLPIPSIRVDGEIWGTPNDFGSGRRGNAFSVLGMQNFAMGYAGLGPSYYFTDTNGDHKSGFGVKIMGGLSLPDNAYVEAGLIWGPSSTPVFFTIGKHF